MESIGKGRTNNKFEISITRLCVLIAVTSLFGAFIMYAINSYLGEDDNSKEQIATLEAQVDNLLANIAAINTLPTPSADERAKAAVEERLDTKFLTGIYDEETVSYVTRATQELIEVLQRANLNGDPLSSLKAGTRLGHYFNYLAEGITNGSVNKSSALSLVARYEEITTLPYLPKFEVQGSSLREAIGHIKFAEPPIVR